MKQGMGGFTDHELLELALFYSRPRVNTNPTAHALLERFGSVKGVLEASSDELCDVNGVGASSALLFQLVTELMRRYEATMSKKTVCYNDVCKIGDYLHPYFLGLGVERLYLLLFNNRMNLLECILLSEGTVNCTNASLRKISELVVHKHASAVVLAHNHPNGMVFPSSADIELTSTVENYLKPMGVVLLEHFIFCDRRYYPMLLHHFSKFRPSPLTGKIESSYYERFYHGITGAIEVHPLFAENAEKNSDTERMPME